MIRLATLLSLLFPLGALAAQTVSLPAKRVVMTEGSAAMWDLSAELKKMGIGKDKATSRLVQIDLKLKAGFTGATVGLMLGGIVVDSDTVIDDTEATMTLGADSEITNAPWVLAVRGEVQFIEVRVTVDAAADAPANPEPAPRPEEPAPRPAPAPAPAPTPTTPEPDVVLPDEGPIPTPRPNPNGPPAPAATDLTPGQKLIAVSESSGTIDYVTLVRRERNGTYVVSFDGAEYGGWLRSQFAVLKGCAGPFCVGQAVSWSGWSQARDLKVVGILGTNGKQVILESRAARTLVAARISELRKPVATPPPAPRPAPVDRNPRNLRRGQYVVVVSANNVSASARIVDVKDGAVSVQMDQTGETQTFSATSDRVAVLEGCSQRACTGQMARTYDRAGRPLEVTVVGLQSETLVVVRASRTGQLVGNWPVQALEFW